MENIIVENAKIAFKNFSGKEGQFNPEGKRNFCLILDHELAEKLHADGWNVRTLKPKDDGEIPQPYIQVSVSFLAKPPKIVLVTSRGKTLLTEETVGMLDWAEITNVDLSVTPYQWSVAGKNGVKAYLKNMYVTIQEDEFEKKYDDIPDSAMGSIML